jgi:3-hydroxyacyl-[acyl-carrier-protein] dehydratase
MQELSFMFPPAPLGADEEKNGVSGKHSIIDISHIDLDRVIADIHEIRRCNPQRHEMEQLTAIVFEDLERKICVGYKDISRDEFWVRGHMPGMPLMPGVVMLEAAAQICSYFTQKHNLLGADMVGFGGVDAVRFRDPVIPGDRLVLACQLVKARPRRMIVSRFEGWVGSSLVVEGEIRGIPIPTEVLQGLQKETAPRPAE